ncbi:MAG: circularly permuted type 2 ATP-grasp protein [Parvularculaceae bacterium]|nr:circularly permuted type 2 ATP-grasp protein [Parvularculaceae bacterium]
MGESRVFFDEMHLGDDVRPEYAAVADWLSRLSTDDLKTKRAEAEALFRKIGITFAVYGEGGDPERLIPFDLVPRVFSAGEWDRIDAGVKQRAQALNMFLADVYNKGEVFNAGVVPRDAVQSNEAFLHQMAGFEPPGGVYTHVVGIDLVRTGPDEFYVLEDNCRTPSGVSYVLENRAVMTRLFPDLFRQGTILPVDDYSDLLRKTLTEVAPSRFAGGKPNIVVLTPGHYNSAYYEHSFLAYEMAVPLVQGSDLFVEDGIVYMRTTLGPERVDVIYRRIDDDFLDPEAFRADSQLGVPGLMEAYKNGTVTIANAPGGGVADDKAIYTYMPDIIRFYLGEEAIIPNVPTWKCADPDDFAYVMDHLPELVVKEVHGSGGYGMLVGPAATKAEIEAYADRLRADPKDFIAQPTLSLSTVPSFVEEGIAPRHVDFRPYALVGKKVRLIPGGLSRVAMREGSLVVNSSQGGGVKDTWVLRA